MSSRKRVFIPSYANPPGRLLEEELDLMGVPQGEFARRCGCTVKEIKEIIAGAAPIGPQTAIQIALISGGDPDFWLRMESNYRLRLAQLELMETSPQYAEWAGMFPIEELAARDEIEESDSMAGTVCQLLTFFGVANLEQWWAKEATARDARRFSSPFDGDEALLASWLQLGEIEAVYAKCPEYDETRFKKSLGQIRSLTAGGKDDVRQEAQHLCRRAGVVLVLTEPLAGLEINGAAWWFSPEKAVIQLNPRQETDDLLWSTFFHEAAHIILHNKAAVFIDLPGRPGKTAAIPEDAEADAWAKAFLVGNP